MIPEDDAVRKFQRVISRVDPRLILDRGNIRFVATPYRGVEFGLRLGTAAALLFMPDADLAAPDWETRLFKRFEAARRYLDGFPREETASKRRAPAAAPRASGRRV